ncbi:NFACT family protein [Paenibacillus sp. OV219]|uniref:Rqc2 family fibronectin-binding protein n=1 Tax=Paenibacillus sp. OV219 TaxID=1884377 RepID=UPI0008C53DC3|nr:NFACT RNA binding domain-containing protein [Paenibacillus sp. OV219]SEM76165.1 Predicted component of the ribosome quality control (RQC) complex, YloA/Tae2 family, contains fibronectin-binding (FbpA) and DUF814 domains [Paenibacillus sp. OV219]
MALDGIVTRAITHELQACIGARIYKIHQPGPHDLVLQIRGGGVQGKLLISANPTYPRIHFTEQSFINPMEAPMFCMLLRKHCEGAVIEAVRQVGNERIIHLDVRQRDELGDMSFKRIIIELMGKHSNIILVDAATEMIHDGIHHVTPMISSYRVIMPGTTYVAPPEQGKDDPLAIADEATFSVALRQTADALINPPIPDEDSIHFGSVPKAADPTSITLNQLLVGAFSGLSPLLAKEIIHRSTSADESSPLLNGADHINVNAARVWPAFRDMMEQFRSNRYEAQMIAASSSSKPSFSVTELTHLEGAVVTFETVSLCLEAFYGDKAQRDTVKQRANDLIKFLQNERNKNVKKQGKLAETLQEAKDADKFRSLGELLTMSLHTIQRGDDFVETIDYYDEEQPIIKIALDPLLTPSQNAQRYFKRYTKYRNSLTVVAEQMERTSEEMAYLESLLQQLESASLSDIDEIRDELVEQGYLRSREKRGAKKRKPKQPALLCYTSSEGVPIFVGKNNTQNDFLTNKSSAPNDTWLHTKDIPGSHVVIRGTSFGDETLEEAAMLAAHFSQAKSSSSVPVDYTLIRYVKKPSGAKPGYVIYDNQKTLFITPDEPRIKGLPSVIKQ